MNLIFVIGATNAGKSTLIEAAKHLGHGTVEVGKAMRAKHPPEYFKGSGAPEHTEIEAWQCMLDEMLLADQVRLPDGSGWQPLPDGSWVNHVTGAFRFGAGAPRFCFIDGQPRSLRQFHRVRRDFPHYQTTFLHLWAPNTEREIRARNRDRFDAAKLELSLSRLNGDLPVLYDIIFHIANDRLPITHMDTNKPNYNAQDMVRAAVATSAGYAQANEP